MAIAHKFQNRNWENFGFSTENTILKNKKYKPEVLILGTYNPDTPNDNHADFFYGRNWLWPAFKNLFIENEIIHMQRRMPTNGAPNFPLNPTIEDVFTICKKAKLSFADLVGSVMVNSDN